MAYKEKKELLQKRIVELKKQGKVELLHSRFCIKSDIEGFRKIIQDNSRISFAEIIPKNPPWLSFAGRQELFYTTSDEKFNIEAKQLLMDNIMIGK